MASYHRSAHIIFRHERRGKHRLSSRFLDADISASHVIRLTQAIRHYFQFIENHYRRIEAKLQFIAGPRRYYNECQRKTGFSR